MEHAFQKEHSFLWERRRAILMMMSTVMNRLSKVRFSDTREEDGQMVATSVDYLFEHGWHA